MKSWGRHILLFTYFSLVLITNVWKGWHPHQTHNSVYEVGYLIDHSIEGHSDSDKSLPNQNISDSDTDIVTILVLFDQLPYDHFIDGRILNYHFAKTWYLLPAFDITTPPPQV